MNDNKESQVELRCDIVGDLLPLYHDKVVSEGTREAVSRHISTCEKCKNEYNILNERLPENIDGGEEGKKEKRISSFLQEVRRRGILKGIFVTIMAVAVLIAAGYVLMYIPLISVSSNDIFIEYVFEEQGNFFIVYKQPVYKNPTMLSTKYDGDRVMLNYKIPIIHFPVRQDDEISILTLEKKCMDEQGCSPKKIFYQDKEIYSDRNKNKEKEVPEYVKTYFEYSNAECGFVSNVDEEGIELYRLEEEGSDALINRRKKWDWEGNLLYDREKKD